MIEKARQPKRLPRGFWDSADGRVLLAKLRRRETTAKEVADQLHITESAVYNALSKRHLKQAPIPIAADPALDRLLASIEEFLGEVVTTRLKDLERRAKESEARAEAAERELETLRGKTLDQAGMLQSLHTRLGERVMKATDVSAKSTLK